MAEKVCVITGGANGIGLATARMLAEQGEIVVLADWDEEALARSGGNWLPLEPKC